jgi:hypothetical protein
MITKLHKLSHPLQLHQASAGVKYFPHSFLHEAREPFLQERVELPTQVVRLSLDASLKNEIVQIQR